METTDCASSGDSARATSIGLFVIGAGWLGGATVLDLFAHDLGRFATESQFRSFIAGFFGSGSPLGTVGTAVLVGVYRYGELAVLLSAPMALAAAWVTYNYDGVDIPGLARVLDLIGGR